jgi:hypothetical protein
MPDAIDDAEYSAEDVAAESHENPRWEDHDECDISLCLLLQILRSVRKTGHHFSTHGRSTTSKAQVDRCCRCSCR